VSNTTTPLRTSPATTRLEPTVRTVTVVTTPPEPTRVSKRVPVAVFVMVLILGGGVRLASLLSDRCLWIDEAMLALNLVNRSPRQLFDPLDWNQGAPVGFLLAVKASISVFGVSEWALRLVPFAASCAGMIGFAWVSRRLLSPYGALFATVLFAFSPYLVSYAGECKQYACDASIAIGLFATALGLLEGKGGWRWAMLACAGAVAVWCSHPAAFVLGGIGTALLAKAAVSRDRKRFLSASLTVSFWLVSFGACYLICLKQLGGNKYLTNYWTDHFMALPPKSLGDLSWVADHLIAFFTTPGGFGGLLVPLGGFAAVLALIGLREFGRERWPVTVALAMPVALVMFASGLHKYPFGGRLLLFLVPFAVLAVANGAWAIFEALREKNRFAALAVLALMALASGWQTFDVVRRPLRHEQLTPVMEKIRRDMQPGDGIYVYYSAIPAFTFYTRERPLGESAITFGEEHRGDPTGYIAELSKLHGRVWIIFSHPHNYEETVIRTALDCRGKCDREVKLPGAAAWLYRLPE
jgi:hypothetical protein